MKLRAVLCILITCQIACSDDTPDQCPRDTKECLSGLVGRVCPSDGSGWISFTCPEDEVCQDGECIVDTANQCTNGTKECIDDQVARMCSGGAWVNVPCGLDATCHVGDCVADAYCTPNEVVCATNEAIKTCELDGSAWVITACQPNEVCTSDACEIDLTGGVCTPGERICLDSQTALICEVDGVGYTQIDCPSTCAQGTCTGTICIPGESRCADTVLSGGASPTTLFTCVGGTHWEEAECTPGDLCMYDGVDPTVGEQFYWDLTAWKAGDAPFPPTEPLPPSPNTASCATPVCTSFALDENDWQVCGNPLDGTVDPTTAYSVCQGFPPYGNTQWVEYRCGAPATCDSTVLANLDPGDPVCRTECEPGASRCVDNGTPSPDEKYQVCGVGGTWGAPIDCQPVGGASRACVVLTSGLLPEAVCMVEACASAWADGLESGEGLCTTTGLLQECLADGTLGTPASCPYGRCEPDVPIGPYVLGQCESECTDGVQECTVGAQNYRECQNGIWATQVCNGTDLCFEYSDTAGLSRVLCGAECAPGTRECEIVLPPPPPPFTPPTRIRECVDGIWGPLTDCVAGTYCTRGGDWGASCYAMCQPGDVRCTGSLIQTCGANGWWPAPEPCPNDPAEICLIDGAGATAGCGECLGLNTAGGSYTGRPDERCATATEAIEVCGADNTWATAASTDCPTDWVCHDYDVDDAVFAWCMADTTQVSPSCDGTTTGHCERLSVPGGQFPMGRSTNSAASDYWSNSTYPAVSYELPEHLVTVGAFDLDKHEVSVARFQRFVRAYADGWRPYPGQSLHPRIAATGWRPEWDDELPVDVPALLTSLQCYPQYDTYAEGPPKANLPLNCASWYVAFSFCAWEGGRLPTEAEWEFAAAGGDENRLYPWGATAASELVCTMFCHNDSIPGCQPTDVVPIGTMSATSDGRWGHSDMAGSMWEWTFDAWNTTFYSLPEATGTDVVNLGPADNRTRRGGGFNNDPSAVRSVFRRIGDAWRGGHTTGFRCAYDP
ncbi:formylglycine-generating enzyme family protein [Myxococcota bacterium]